MHMEAKHNNNQSPPPSNHGNQQQQLKLCRETFLFQGQESESVISQQFYSFQAQVRNSDKPLLREQDTKQEGMHEKGGTGEEYLLKQDNKEEYIVDSLSNQLRTICKEIAVEVIERADLQQYRRTIQQKIAPLYLEFCQAYDNLTANIDFQTSIRTYSHILVRYWNEDQFFQHFIQNKYLCLLMTKARECKYSSEIVRVVFECLEYLLKGLKAEAMPQSAGKEEQFIYLLVMINKEGFITEGYRFSEREDWAYYVHFIKLLVRIINQVDRAQQFMPKPTNQKQISQTLTFNQNQQPLKVKTSLEIQQKHSKYLTIFFNQKTPEFPLMLKLLYFYKWDDAILQTSIKLCLLEISNHPNRKLQKYLLNFPFITFYLLYCTKIGDNIQKYMTLAGTRSAHQPQSQKQQSLVQQILSDIKFLQDYLRIQGEQPTSPLSPRTNNIHQHLNMYINTFFYYVGRGFYQTLCKFVGEGNLNGLVNGFILGTRVLRVNTVLKIRLGVEEMLHKYVNCQLWGYLRAKREKLDSEKYWIFDQCADIIREHAQTILFNDSQLQQPSTPSPKTTKSYFQSESLQVVQLPSSSNSITSKSIVRSPKPSSSSSKKSVSTSYSSIMFKVMRSYLPSTNYSWLHNELKKISQVLGLDVGLNREVQHFGENLDSNTYYKQSFLYLIDKIQEYHYHGSNKMVLKSKKSMLSRFSSPIKPNPLFSYIVGAATKGVVKHASSSGKIIAQNDGKRMYEDSSEELLYYYLVMMCSIKDDGTGMHGCGQGRGQENDNVNLEEIWELLKVTRKCRSLMLVGMMYWYIKLLDYQLHETNYDFSIPSQSNNYASREKINQTEEKQKGQEQTLAAELLENYVQTMSKLVYYVLTQGWGTFMRHVREIKKVIWNKQGNGKDQEYELASKNAATQFSNDIFRDIECDIVYFVMLRHIFGTRNTKNEVMEEADHHIENMDSTSKEIKVLCRLGSPQSEQVYLIMDGQYIKFTSLDDLPLTKKPLSISSYLIFQEQSPQKKQIGEMIASEIKGKVPKGASFDLVDKGINGECFTVHFEEIPIQQYVAKEIKWRKKIIADIEMSLRTIRFEIQ